VKDDIFYTAHLPFPLFIFGGEVIGSPPPPVSIEITERGGFYVAKKASRWKKLPRRNQK
jgi:hypothetical protein